MRIRRILLALALSLGTTAATVIPAAPAQARACIIDHYCYTTYYKDAAKTIVVGEKYESCSGAVSFWGSRSSYVTFREYPCLS